MIVERYLPHFEKLLIILAFCFGLFALIYNIIVGQNYSKVYLTIIVPILLSTLIYAVLIGSVANYLVQFIIIFSCIFPLLLIEKISTSGLLRISKIIFIIAFLQLFFDLLLPNPEYSELDKYTGTFNSGNDKARFLLFILLSFYFLGKKILKVRPFGFLFRFIYTIPIVLSTFIGFSMFAYITLLLAIISGFIFKKLLPFLIVNIVGFVLTVTLIYNVEFDKKTPGPIKYNYHRFFDLEHGVAAVYSYGWEILKSNEYIFGVGLGNWVSRSGQLFNSPYLKDNPSTMISFGTLYTKTTAPPGLSAFFIQVIELGLVGIPLIFLFLHYLFEKASTTRYGLISFFFIFYFINYSPLFFEFQSLCYLFLSSYLIFNKLLLHK
jgi:hypothetical protein